MNHNIKKLNMKTKTSITGILLCAVLAISSAMAAVTNPPAIVPLPQKMELRDGSFQFAPDTLICSDVASGETGKFLAEPLRKSTGYSLELKGKVNDGLAVKGAILLT